MTKIYKRSDRIKLKIDDVVVTLAPLSFDQKTEAQDYMLRGRAKSDYKLMSKSIAYSIQQSVKDISGLENEDGTPYKLEFENGVLTDTCIDDLFNIELHKKLVMICTSLTQGIPQVFTDENGKPIEGVEFIRSQEAPNPN
jgi:hypothetical protein